MPIKKSINTPKQEISKKVLPIFLIFCLLIISAAFVWTFLNYQKAKKRILHLSTPEARQELAEQESSELLDKIKRHIILPTEESPMIAVIKNIESLISEQEFYKDAKNGDKLVVYKRIAIIYDPDRDILVNVGPVYTKNQQELTEDDNISVSEKIKREAERNRELSEIKNQIANEESVDILTLDIRNGSETVGAANNLKDELGILKKYDIINMSNAANSEYSENILINLKDIDIEDLESRLGIVAIKELPEIEKESDADVIIILGNK
ncbi:MAG: LytR C-terminal domain-containing protein [Patescibacteria group bacterium]|nr:LytR C-terminal domain-containing protein [Patescibacteria group bacterium]